MTENEISKVIVECAIEEHRTLGGPGLLESAYVEPFCWEIGQRGRRVERELQVPLLYKGRTLASPLRLDLLVEKRVIVDVKAVAVYNAIFEAQALTYLRLLDLRLALIITFGEKLVKNGIHCVVNGL